MKYEFYNRASNVESARVRQTVHRTADDLRFDIEILKNGLIEEILDIPFSTLATPPKGEVLPAGESTVKETGPNGEPVELVGYPVKWNPGSNPPENFDVPLREALQMLGGQWPKTTRYVTYEVNVSLDGKSRRYRAVALFYEGFETSDTPKIWVVDHISGGGFNMPVRLLYENRAPVKSNPAPPGLKKQAILGLAEEGGESPLVCSFETRKCCWKPGFRYPGYDYPACEPGRSGNDEGSLGMSSFQSNSSWPTVIAAATTCGGSPEEPVPCRYFVSEKRTEKSGRDNIGHWVGDHWGRIKTTGYCRVLPDCSSECGHDDPEITYGDSGISLTCHKGFDGHHQISNRAKYSPANPPKCSQHANVTF